MALNTPGAGDDGRSPPPPPSAPSPWPTLFLDSGSSCHMVGDPRLLSDLRNAPAGWRVSMLDGTGTSLRMTKIGNIQMTTAGFTIPGVFLVPGLKYDSISVRQLWRQSRIWTWFDDRGRAILYAGSELVGVALAQENLGGLYVLQFLRTQPVRFPWSQFPPLRVNTRKPLRLHILDKQMQLQLHMQKQGLLPMHGGDDGSSSSSPRPSRPPKLLLDSGASSHTVSDSRFLCNLRDAPAGLMVEAANGNTMPVTKIGDIHIQGFTVPDVLLVPGLEDDGGISVGQLARDHKICMRFVGDWAFLYAGAKVVGVAVTPREDLAGAYILQTPKIPAA